jgi:hypothetical protein
MPKGVNAISACFPCRQKKKNDEMRIVQDMDSREAQGGLPSPCSSRSAPASFASLISFLSDIRFTVNQIIFSSFFCYRLTRWKTLHYNLCMKLLKRYTVILSVLILSLLVSGMPAYADHSFAEGGRQVGKGFAQIFRATGSAFKKSGKAVGKGFRQAGKETGKAFRQMGKEIGRAFSGKN